MKCSYCQTEKSKRYRRGYCIICYNRLLRNKIIFPLKKAPRPKNITDVQGQILEGLMLGDGHLEKRFKNPILRVERSILDIEYLDDNFSVFKEFCASKIRIREKESFGTKRKLANFSSLSCEAFIDTHNRWFIDNKKKVPKDICLTPLVCAIWFCDDGCLFNNRNTLGLQLATHSFTEDEVQFLSKKISDILKANLKCSKIKKRDKYYYIIRGYGESAIKFIEYIKDFVPISMNRKLEKYKIVSNV